MAVGVRPGAWGAAGLCAALLCLPLVAGAQASVSAVTLRADLRDGVEALVELEVSLAGATPADSVSFSLLDFPGGAAADLRAGIDEAPVALLARGGAARGGWLRVGDGVVRVRYRVPLPPAGPGGALTVHVPVLSVDLPPTEARLGLFRAEVLTPPGWVVTEGFPTGLVRVAGSGSLSAELQVVPSVVTVRARADGAWRPGLPLVLDAVAVVGLLLFSVVGWRHLTDGGP